MMIPENENFEWSRDINRCGDVQIYYVPNNQSASRDEMNNLKFKINYVGETQPTTDTITSTGEPTTVTTTPSTVEPTTVTTTPSTGGTQPTNVTPSSTTTPNNAEISTTENTSTG